MQISPTDSLPFSDAFDRYDILPLAGIGFSVAAVLTLPLTMYALSHHPEPLAVSAYDFTQASRVVLSHTPPAQPDLQPAGLVAEVRFDSASADNRGIVTRIRVPASVSMANYGSYREQPLIPVSGPKQLASLERLAAQ